MPHHLEPVPPGRAEDPMEPFELDVADLDEGLDPPPLARPAWWRCVAIAVILAMVVTGPLAVVIVRLLR